MQPIEVAIIGVGGTLLGAIAGAAITYYFALRIAKTNTRIIAGIKLRAAFAPEIAIYKLNINRGDKWHINMMDNMFKEALTKHAAAIEEYRPFVPRESQRAYQQVWENYYSDFLEYYDTGEGEQSVFKKRIDAIFKFTEG